MDLIAHIYEPLRIAAIHHIAGGHGKVLRAKYAANAGKCQQVVEVRGVVGILPSLFQRFGRAVELRLRVLQLGLALLQLGLPLVELAVGVVDLLFSGLLLRVDLCAQCRNLRQSVVGLLCSRGNGGIQRGLIRHTHAGRRSDCAIERGKPRLRLRQLLLQYGQAGVVGVRLRDHVDLHLKAGNRLRKGAARRAGAAALVQQAL